VLIQSSGILTYQGEYCVKLLIDQNILNYYFSLIPKYFNAQKQAWPAHITVVREKKGLEIEIPKSFEPLGKYEGEKIDFCYRPVIIWENAYFWLNCYSARLEEIRRELGLPTKSQITTPPEGFNKTFHSTVGNKK